MRKVLSQRFNYQDNDLEYLAAYEDDIEGYNEDDENFPNPEDDISDEDDILKKNAVNKKSAKNNLADKSKKQKKIKLQIEDENETLNNDNLLN